MAKIFGAQRESEGGIVPSRMAAKLVLEPIFEADFLSSSYGFRPRIGAVRALETIRTTVNAGSRHVLDADIRDYFGSIDQTLLMERVSRRVSDRRVRKLLRGWLQAGVMEDGVFSETTSGTPQGGVISPLLSNMNPIGKPCAGKPHARFERGWVETVRSPESAPPTYQ